MSVSSDLVQPSTLSLIATTSVQCHQSHSSQQQFSCLQTHQCCLCLLLVITLTSLMTMFLLAVWTKPFPVYWACLCLPPELTNWPLSLIVFLWDISSSLLLWMTAILEPWKLFCSPFVKPPVLSGQLTWHFQGHPHTNRLDFPDHSCTGKHYSTLLLIQWWLIFMIQCLVDKQSKHWTNHTWGILILGGSIRMCFSVKIKLFLCYVLEISY